MEHVVLYFFVSPTATVAVESVKTLTSVISPVGRHIFRIQNPPIVGGFPECCGSETDAIRRPHAWVTCSRSVRSCRSVRPRCARCRTTHGDRRSVPALDVLDPGNGRSPNHRRGWNWMTDHARHGTWVQLHSSRQNLPNFAVIGVGYLFITKSYE